MKFASVSAILLLVGVCHADDLCDVTKPSDRLEGGWAGISAEQCHARGMCWDTRYAARWCFQKADPRCLSVRPSDRLEGGWPGITPDQCAARGMCFDSKVPNVRWCFQKQNPACVAVQPSERVECGWPGVTPDQCAARGCCFDSTVANVKWCFKKAVAGVIGEAMNWIDGRDVPCRVQECTLGDLVTDAILEYFKETKKIDVLVMMNGGAFQNNVLLQPGDIKQADIQKIFPFKDTIDYVELSGSDVIAALEHSVANYDPCNIKEGPFMQVAGLKVTYDLSKPSGQRVERVVVAAPLESSTYPLGYAPINPNGKYKVSSNNFILDGGDGYSVFKDKLTPESRVVGPLDTDVVSTYIRKHSPINWHDNGRIFIRSVPAKKC